ncbi:MAG: hypothetical protein IH812_07880 [Proteobacteria bacterium]|nr:hypothetical protein [Pseudomonadota bacterium]
MSAGKRSTSQQLTTVRVECYAGYRGEETPRRFHLGEKAEDVVEVLDRWLSPEYRYFKCLGADGGTYILRHDVQGDRWELTFYQRGNLDPDRVRPGG